MASAETPIGTARSRFAPDTPTLLEQGLKDMNFSEWFGFYLPGKAAADVVQRANTALRAALAEPYPQLANMLLGGTTPILSADELQQLGFKIMVDPVATLLAAGAAVRTVANALLDQGRVDSLADELQTFDEVKQVLGLYDFV